MTKMSPITTTKPTTIVALAVAGIAVGALVEFGLAASGRPVIILPITLAIALAALGGIIVSLAVPIRRMTKVAKAPKVDPFYATRILMLAKACSITGALMFGVGIGAVVYLLTRTVVSTGVTWQSAATILGAGVLLAGGLVAEHLCRVPPGKDDDEAGEHAAGA
ncbi:MAG: DUF3180 domain-containing protein [Cryobacterium sp.]|nr:DUF3180 domain-containing protein [Cryobacterium sp.]MCC7128641.1 DUF3180 domain-containing protein [Microbacteriaceae bacterium]